MGRFRIDSTVHLAPSKIQNGIAPRRMINRSLAYLLFAAATVRFASAAAVELYQVPGTLLSATNDKFAVRTTSRNASSQPTESKVTVLAVESGHEMYQVSSLDVLDTFPIAPVDNEAVSTLHHGFGKSAAIAGSHILVGAPGRTLWECDCTVEPSIEERGRPGRAFVFDIFRNSPAIELDAPDLTTLRQDQSYRADDHWLYFGHRVAATSSIGLVNGRTYDLASGEMLMKLEAGDPFFDSAAVSSTNAVISHAWRQDLSVYSFLGEKVRTLTAPLTGDRNGQTIALEGNLALVGVPGPKFRAGSPGSAHLFDIRTGEELMSFSAMNQGVMSIDGGDGFGRAVAIYGNWVLIGAPYDSELGNWSGAAYLFEISTGELLEKILPTSREYPVLFGSNVAMTNGFALIEDLTYAGRDQNPMTLVYTLVPEPSALKLVAIAMFGCIVSSGRGGRASDSTGRS
jgi:hypothetical protein